MRYVMTGNHDQIDRTCAYLKHAGLCGLSATSHKYIHTQLVMLRPQERYKHAKSDSKGIQGHLLQLITEIKTVQQEKHPTKAK